MKYFLPVILMSILSVANAEEESVLVSIEKYCLPANSPERNLKKLMIALTSENQKKPRLEKLDELEISKQTNPFEVDLGIGKIKPKGRGGVFKTPF